MVGSVKTCTLWIEGFEVFRGLEFLPHFGLRECRGLEFLPRFGLGV